MKILLLDNYDSFTYNLYDYLLQSGAHCEVYRNDALSLEAFKQLDFDALVLSPGPERPAQAGLMMPLIAHFFDKKPILGICLGHQALGEFFGARLVRAALPMHGKTSQITHTGHPLFAGLPLAGRSDALPFLAFGIPGGQPTSIHRMDRRRRNYGLESSNLAAIGGTISPESILTEGGLQMLKNWVEGGIRRQETGNRRQETGVSQEMKKAKPTKC